MSNVSTIAAATAAADVNDESDVNEDGLSVSQVCPLVLDKVEAQIQDNKRQGMIRIMTIVVK